MSTTAGAVRVASPTEGRNPRTTDLDRLGTLDLVRALHAEDAQVPAAVAAALPQLAEAVDLVVAALRRGGRIHYFGAGSSGRFGVLDAAEVPPTYGLPADRFVAHLAGGEQAMTAAVESVEDHADAGHAAAAQVGIADVAVGLTASGRTPYVAGALTAARAAGARTVLISGNPHAPLAALADVHIAADTGPEAVMGSTRMKAGTAQKLVLHTLSTAAMVRLGRTYSNLMVDVVATNAKLRGRVLAILVAATGVDEQTGRRVLADSGGDLKTAIVAVLSDLDPVTARIRLDEAGGHVRQAIAARP
ncbi:N-acetylmuramic acid 6-phosphate etherase [Catellatospora sp. IY07-71]|uniref:N-acetylmuramic acid 6-phosphate etherase n=1 Tax=Catellatospora sp. IY07-71 TaxID=2728827 RepID=UPI001BB44C8E|nr:N-acetylmuramic acid 6-phosphate etherase [Catellatospora sp. IY07-71]BCJ75182.1 N-acetylmuramic acid 6-phosphate etherase [Catellatospora sp. IY07-71]